MKKIDALRLKLSGPLQDFGTELSNFYFGVTSTGKDVDCNAEEIKITLKYLDRIMSVISANKTL